jgi:chemotaxis protein MotB
MARKPREKFNDKAWMDTYSDMVTLLMCFFVLLFSMSTLDATKWRILVNGFNPNAEVQSQVILDQTEEPDESTTAVSDGGESLLTEDAGRTLSEESTSSMSQEDIETMDDLYTYLEAYVEQNDLEDQIKLFQGEDYTYVMFSNNIFFDGDSSVLKREGKNILDVFGGAIGEVGSLVSKLQVMGHTNQADPDKPNNVETDRFLSSNRAVEVLIYLQKKNIVAPGVLESIGYGQYYPIGSFTDPVGRAKNRRVELIIAEGPTADINLDKVYSDIKAAQASGQITETIVDPNV